VVRFVQQRAATADAAAYDPARDVGSGGAAVETGREAVAAADYFCFDS
jgi:hypothetical protein